MTIGTSSKKIQERFFLDQFLSCQGIVPAQIEEREEPDFLIHLDGKIVGVEVTQLFIRETPHGSREKAVEAVTDRIVAEARNRYVAYCAPPVHLTVNFWSHFTPSTIRRTEVAGQLAELVQSLTLNATCMETIAWDGDSNFNHPLSNLVAFIHALIVPDPSMACWGVGRSGWVAELSVTPLQTRVNEKARKIGTYQLAADEIWLLIVADRMNPPQSFSIPPGFSTETISTPFARTFFHPYPGMAPMEIGIKSPVDSNGERRRKT